MLESLWAGLVVSVIVAYIIKPIWDGRKDNDD